MALFFSYYHHGDIEHARNTIENLPDSPFQTKWWLEPRVLKNEERIRAVQKRIDDIVQMFYELLTSTYARRECGKRDLELLKFKSFLDLVMDDGDYYFYNKHLSVLYLWCALDQAHIQNSDIRMKLLSKKSKKDQ